MKKVQELNQVTLKNVPIEQINHKVYHFAKLVGIAIEAIEDTIEVFVLDANLREYTSNDCVFLRAYTPVDNSTLYWCNRIMIELDEGQYGYVTNDACVIDSVVIRVRQEGAR